MAVIICEGLFKFEGSVKKKRQADRNPDEGLVKTSGVKPVYVSMYVCLYFTLWLDDVVWANLPE